MPSNDELITTCASIYERTFIQKAHFEPDFSVQYIKEGIDEYAIVLDEDNKVAYIVCEGTDIRDGNEEWRSNFQCKLNEYGYHTGFYNAHQKVQFTIAKELNKLDGYLFIFIGYSRGGPLAAMLYLNHKNDKNKCVVFGCPRFGSKTLMKKMFGDMSVINVVIRGDWVTRVPFKLMPYKIKVEQSEWDDDNDEWKVFSTYVIHKYGNLPSQVHKIGKKRNWWKFWKSKFYHQDYFVILPVQFFKRNWR